MSGEQAEQKPRTFECWLCGGIFTTTQTEAEVDAEMEARFGDIPPDEQVSLCDGCHAIYMDRVIGR